ncbi:D-glycero-D-manno-heptose 1,7-bisphosphate phosphatase [Methylacidiphilum kamchatkense Kam1]|uniref:D,D-heptose 1,7-bisphosphate phosphatase n=1 Tax=Methylacidiphilum kamchatkense Kam1 TaxID=1202785 RepID=A0A0C1V3U7_9BACT|nr:HAD-IIIA family hydrolase [Methylacidiphilum kamchatkense]KIE58375.1 D-glycero-D-manno-heptose 1,7-bisphosphate phosphatase [Methylacidiphilum kamchatkense Kam1]QDQ42219.1 D-glycero-D-manno-heptose 1,7-bisphosphate phosphatase [Methylacidiphilum kamchatkense Kam1]
MNKAVFFDRDDTLIKNIPYLKNEKLIEIPHGLDQQLLRLKKAGFLLFIVSNQSGVARGLLTAGDVEKVNQRLLEMVGSSFFEKIYLSYEGPTQEITWDRKPQPTMIWKATKEYDIDCGRSFFVGDRLADVLCGRNSGCKTIFINLGRKNLDAFVACRLATYVTFSLFEAIDVILSVENE